MRLGLSSSSSSDLAAMPGPGLADVRMPTWHVLQCSQMSSDTPQDDTSIPGFSSDVEALREENRRLRSQIEASSMRQRWVLARLLGFTIRVFRLQNLKASLVRLISAIRERKEIPTEETADVITAIVGRILYIGAATVFLALLPTILSVWQISLLRQQLADQPGQTGSRG
jgi:hypothetical protein